MAGAKEGAPGTDSGTGDGSRPSGGCSEPIRNGVLPGKESFTVLMPSDMHFPFTKHWVGVFSDNPIYIGGESLTDIDNDGDLDYAIGQRTDIGGAWSGSRIAERTSGCAIPSVRGTRRPRAAARWT